MAVKFTETEIEELVELNRYCFGDEDDYSDTVVIMQCLYVKSGGCLVHTEGDKIVSYLLFIIKNKVFKCVRMGTLRKYRGRGLAKKLLRRGLVIAKEKGMPYETYCSVVNIGSVNLHLHLGFRIVENRGIWYDLVYDK